jgi:hypothetical protein
MRIRIAFLSSRSRASQPVRIAEVISPQVSIMSEVVQI